MCGIALRRARSVSVLLASTWLCGLSVLWCFVRASDLLQVQQVAWHPNGIVLATACTDFKCRVVSAVVEEVRILLVELCVVR